MYNNYEKNLRNYPTRPSEKKTEVIHKPVSLKVIQGDSFTIKRTSTREDGWESIDRAVGTPHPLNTFIDDENDWGGLGNIQTQNVDVVSPRPVSFKHADYYTSVFKDESKLFTWLIPGVLAGGPHPFYFSHETNLSNYKKNGFKAILSVYDESLTEEVGLNGFEYYFMPTDDGQVCDLTAACKFIDEMDKKNKPVFVHCFGGTGRTGTVLAAYMMYKGWLTADEAISYIRLNYSKYAIETREQEAAIYNFALRL